eukprot:5163550-Amphidinium_carterae.1
MIQAHVLVELVDLVGAPCWPCVLCPHLGLSADVRVGLMVVHRVAVPKPRINTDESHINTWDRYHQNSNKALCKIDLRWVPATPTSYFPIYNPRKTLIPSLGSQGVQVAERFGWHAAGVLLPACHATELTSLSIVSGPSMQPPMHKSSH